jgi:hypothetical protein
MNREDTELEKAGWTTVSPEWHAMWGKMIHPTILAEKEDGWDKSGKHNSVSMFMIKWKNKLSQTWKS